MNSSIEFIVRGVIIKNGKILLCKNTEHKNYFLPGGHVEFLESAEVALARELNEEVGVTPTDLKFIGIFEHSFGQGERVKHEVNIIYSAEIKEENILSKETHITFEWVPLDTLLAIKFLPQVFAEAIAEWYKNHKLIYQGTFRGD